MSLQLRNADHTLKLFVTAFLIVLSVGYAIGLFFVEHQTSFGAPGVQEQFLGNENSTAATELRYAKSANEMFIFMHNHILSMALVFFIVGGILYFTSTLTENVKRILIVEPFIALITTFGSIALVRYVSPLFSWLVLLSGTSLVVCYVFAVGAILRELWFTRTQDSHPGPSSKEL